MPRRTDQTAVQEESKYPEENTQRFDKDDQKQQMKEQRESTKSSKSEPSHVTELQSKVDSSDYSESTGTPEERLNHLSKDVNAIVVERDRIEHEKQVLEDADFWKQERSDKSGSDSPTKKGSEPQTSKIINDTASIPSKQKTQTSSGVEKKVETSEEAMKKDEKSVRWPSQGATSQQPQKTQEQPQQPKQQGQKQQQQRKEPSVEQQSPAFQSEIRSKIDTEPPVKQQKQQKVDIKQQQGDIKKQSADQQIERKSKIDNTQDDLPLDDQQPDKTSLAKESTHFSFWNLLGVPSAPKEHHLGNAVASVTNSEVGTDGVGILDLRMEKIELDRQKALRAEQWKEYEPLREDPANLRANEELSEHHMSLTSSLPHGSIVRTKQSASSAFSPATTAMENSDQTRTQTRTGRNRVMEMGKDEALLSQRDFVENVELGQASNDRSYRTPTRHLDVNGRSVDGVSESKYNNGQNDFQDANQDQLPQQPSGRSWNDSSMKSSRVFIPTYLPPDERRVKDSEPGMINTIKSKLHDAKESVAETLHDAKDSVTSKLHSTKDTIEDDYDSAKLKMKSTKDRVGDRIESTKDTIEDKAEYAKDSVKSKLNSTKETIEDDYDSAKSKMKSTKDKISNKLESAKDTVVDKLEDGLESVKETIVGGYESAKDRVSGWKDDASAKVHQTGTTIEDKTNELTAKISSSAKDVKKDARDLKQDIAEDWSSKKSASEKKLKEWKEDVKEDAAYAKKRVNEKGREWKNDIKSETRDAKTNIKEGAHILRERSEKNLHEAEHKGQGIMDRIKSWWSPEVKERHLVVDSSPEGVHLKPEPLEEEEKHRATSSRRDFGIISSKPPSFTVRKSDLNPIHVPTSLQGLGGGTDLPSPQMPSTTLTKSNGATISDIPIYVPNSLRGLESNDLASSEMRPDTPRGVDIDAPLRAKTSGGLVHNLTHAFDRRDASSNTYPGSPTREDKLMSSARDFWDLKGQDSSSPSYRPVSPAQSLAATLKGDDSPMGFSSSYSSTISPAYAWSIQSDDNFRELMAETME